MRRRPRPSLIELFHKAIDSTMKAMPQPIIAALQGPVAGGGLGLAMAWLRSRDCRRKRDLPVGLYQDRHEPGWWHDLVADHGFWGLALPWK